MRKTLQEAIEAYLAENEDESHVTPQMRHEWEQKSQDALFKFPLQAGIVQDHMDANHITFGAVVTYMIRYGDYRFGDVRHVPETVPPLPENIKFTLQRIVVWIGLHQVLEEYENVRTEPPEPEPMKVVVNWKHREEYDTMECVLEGEQTVKINELPELLARILNHKDPVLGSVSVNKVSWS